MIGMGGGARKGGQALFAGGKKLEVTEGGVFFFKEF